MLFGMSPVPTSRAELLLKVYIGLFVLAIALTGVLVQRHFSVSSGFGGTVVAAAPREAPRGYGPTINWGGAKR